MPQIKVPFQQTGLISSILSASWQNCEVQSNICPVFLTHKVLQALDPFIFASLFDASIPKLLHDLNGCSSSSHHICFLTSRKEYRKKKKKEKHICRLSIKDIIGGCCATLLFSFSLVRT